MKKEFLSLITLLFVSVLIVNAQDYYVKSGNGLNLRSGPGANHSVVTSIPAKGKVKVINNNGDWWEVEYEGKKGYVSSDYLTEDKGEANSSRKNANNNSARTSSSQGKSASSSSNSQGNWGIGLRLGDPSGISIKKYTDNRSFELSIGRTHLWYGRDWYDKKFDKWYDDKNYGYKDFQYLGHDASAPIGIQFHYLFNKQINKIGEETIAGFHWYYGIGGQLRFQRYTFDYRYKLEGSPEWIYAGGERVTDFDIGADGVIGLEYRFKDIPVSLFTDVTLFMEVLDNPFLFWFQGGIGGRYNF